MVLEMSSPNASIALGDGESIAFQSDFSQGRYANKAFYPALEAALETLGDRSLETVIVGVGPGSYSGVRIALAGAIGLGLSLGAQVVGISSLCLLQGVAFLGIGDGRRGKYYALPFSADGKMGKLVLFDQDIFLEKLKAWQQSGKKLVSLEKSPAFLQYLSQSGMEDACEEIRPHAVGLLKGWLSLSDDLKQWYGKRELAPLYLQAPFVSQPKEGHPLLR